MKLKFIYTVFLALLGATLWMSNSLGRAAGGGGNATIVSYSGGGGCHKGGTFAASAALTISQKSGVVTEYIPGQTYDVEFSIAASGAPAGYGFQLTASNSSNKDAGKFAEFNPANDIQASGLNGRTFIEHNQRSKSNKFKMTWTAPATGTGTVSFYAAGNAVNGANGNNGDSPTAPIKLDLKEGTGVSVQEKPTWATDFSIAPNPVQDFTILQITANEVADAKIIISDLTGRIYTSFHNKIQLGFNAIPLEISDLTNGAYFVTIHSQGNKTLTKKMLISK